MLFVLPILGVLALAHRYLQTYAPTNVRIRRVRSSTPCWRTVAALFALAWLLLLGMHALVDAVETGAPAWLNLLVLILAGDAIKVGCLAIGAALRAMGAFGSRVVARDSRSSQPTSIEWTRV